MIRRHVNDYPLFVTVYGKGGHRLREVLVDPDNVDSLLTLPDDAHDYRIEVPNGDEVFVRLVLEKGDAATRYHQLLQAVAAVDGDDVASLIRHDPLMARARHGGGDVRLGLWLAHKASDDDAVLAPASPDTLRALLGNAEVRGKALEYRLNWGDALIAVPALFNVILGCGESFFVRLPPSEEAARLLIEVQPGREAQGAPAPVAFPVVLLGDHLSSAFHDFLRAGATRAAKQVGAEIAEQYGRVGGSLSRLLAAAQWAIRFAAPHDERILSIYNGLREQSYQQDAAILEWILSYDNPYVRKASGLSDAAEIGMQLGRLLRRAQATPPLYAATLRLLIERADYFTVEPSAEDDPSGKGWSVAKWKSRHADCLAWLDGIRRAVRWDLEFTTYQAARPDLPDPCATVEHLPASARQALVSCRPTAEVPTSTEDLAIWLTWQMMVARLPRLLSKPYHDLSAVAQILVSAIEERRLELDVVRPALQRAISEITPPAGDLMAISQIFATGPAGRRHIEFPYGPGDDRSSHPFAWKVSVLTSDGASISVVMHEEDAPNALAHSIYEDALAEEAASPPSALFADVPQDSQDAMTT